MEKGQRIPNDKVEELILRDAHANIDHGQRTRDTFQSADFFVELKDHAQLENAIWRILAILFSDPYKTPTFDEYAMFMAFAASLRSADLSRQVGAVIAKGNEILATGANDCPCFGGGLYWPQSDGSGEVTDAERGRDY